MPRIDFDDDLVMLDVPQPRRAPFFTFNCSGRNKTRPLNSRGSHVRDQTATIADLRRQLREVSREKLDLERELGTAQETITQLESRASTIGPGFSWPQALTWLVTRGLAGAQQGSDDVVTSNLTELRRRLQDLEAQLRDRPSRAQWDELNSKYAEKEAEIEHYKASSAETELNSLREDNNNLRESMMECTLKVVSLQPPQNIPDHQMTEKYNNFCTLVASWVNEQIRDAEGHLQALGQIYWSPEDSGVIRYACGSVLINDATQAFPRVELKLTQMLVHSILHERVFAHREHVPGLPDSVQDFLLDLDQGEAAFKRRTGERNVRTWTSQCFQALLELKQYQNLRDNRVEEVATQLERIFSAQLVGRPGHAFKKGACYTLLAVASKLADERKPVPPNYVLVLDNEAIGQSCLTVGDRESYKIIDVTTGWHLRPVDETQRQHWDEAHLLRAGADPQRI